ncbi:DUF1353 domain-containing protein [uncultured Maritimibacter sp.]|jgi:hypothetical protein|uniref:DUF1353 domain-containing protein n=1 Tax=uncultured Maritimibacter sp. TaxID=991866 RepID=UPI000A7F53F9|nr:DUF1353 domain-containing protein [uncultured Maritimibacter sp.]
MSLYTDAPADWCEPIGGGDYVTRGALLWEIGRIGSGLWVGVPVGYRFDVSVPRALWWVIDPNDPRFLKAAALHDFALGDRWSRVAAAALFAEALAADGVGRWVRLAATLAVICWRWK